MNGISFLEPIKSNQFRIDFPYFGLFDTAEITPLDKNGEHCFECRLRSGKVVVVKHADQYHNWIDVVENTVTPLSRVLGSEIEDFLKH